MPIPPTLIPYRLKWIIAPIAICLFKGLVTRKNWQTSSCAVWVIAFCFSTNWRAGYHLSVGTQSGWVWLVLHWAFLWITQNNTKCIPIMSDKRQSVWHSTDAGGWKWKCDALQMLRCTLDIHNYCNSGVGLLKMLPSLRAIEAQSIEALLPLTIARQYT